MSVKAKIEAIIYAAEEPVSLNQLVSLLKDSALAEVRAQEQARLALNEVVAEPRSAEVPLDEAALEFGKPQKPAPAAQPATDAAGTESPPNTKHDHVGCSEKDDLKRANEHIRALVDTLIAGYSSQDRGMEIRQIAGGYRMATKPEHHDVVVNFAKSLKPPVRLSLQALETLSVIAYKQPVTVPEISEIRGVDSSGVIATLLDRKLITTAGRKHVIGRPILYKTTKEFLVRFGLNDVSELPSMEEFEKLGEPQTELFDTPAESTNASASQSEMAQEDQSITEADPALVSPENANAAGGSTEKQRKVNQPERFNEALAPVPGVETPD
jgi:segregation and condensation protein B